MSAAKLILRLEETETRIRREIVVEPDLYPDTIAGLQRGDQWILNLGAARIEASAVDLIGIARLILAKLTPPAPK
jgi:predicted metalloprotease